MIDGEMDHVWYSVHSVPMEKIGLDADVALDEWMDTFAKFKMMWDKANYYLFVQAHHDIINISHANAWENNSFEIYFDGDNSKND